MKNYIKTLAVLLMGATIFTACDDNDDAPKYEPVTVSNGAFLVCSGNQSSSIVGSLSYVDYAKSSIQNDVFKSANGRVLGLTANDGVVYGSKMYLAVTEENTIEVVDVKTMRSLKQIKTNIDLGENCLKPRCVTAASGKVYVSFYGGSSSSYDANWNATTTGNGCVVAIDTVEYAKEKIYQAGSFPEGIAVAGGKLYVANSDYAAVTKASVSVIDLATGADTPIKNSQITNPTKVAVDGSGNIYVMDMGNYGDVKGGVRKVSGNTVTTLLDATAMAFDGTHIYTFNNTSYGKAASTYEVYNIQNGQKTTFITDSDQTIYSPNCIGVDPVNGYVLIGAYQKNPDTNKANYKGNGRIFMFKADGTKVGNYECGVGPTSFVFNIGTEYIKK